MLTPSSRLSMMTSDSRDAVTTSVSNFLEYGLWSHAPWLGYRSLNVGEIGWPLTQKKRE